MKLILILIVLLIILQCILSYNIRNNRLISSISSYSKTLLPLSMAWQIIIVMMIKDI